MNISDKFYRKETIDDKEYQITMLPALKAVGMAKTLSKVLLPAIGGTIDGLRDDGFNGAPKTFTELAMTLCTQLDDLDLDAMILTLTKGLVVDGVEVKNVDDFFRGDINGLISVMEFALRSNFSDFFTKNPLIAKLKEAFKGLTEDGLPELV